MKRRFALSVLTTKQRLLHSTSELLRSQGVAGSSARAICESAEVTAPTLYYHFGDLNTLHQQAVEEAFTQSALRKAKATRFADPLDQIRAGWDAYISFALKDTAMFRLMSEGMIRGEKLLTMQRSYERLLELVHQLKQLNVSPDTATQMLWAGAHGAACLLLTKSAAIPVNQRLSEQMREATIAAITSV